MRSEEIWWEDPELKRAGLNLEVVNLLLFPTLREAHLPAGEGRMVWLAPESHDQPSWLISALTILCISLRGHARHKICHLCLFVFAVVVQLLSHVWLFVTPWIAALQTCLSFTISQSLLKLMSIESVMLSNLILYSPLLLLLPSIFPSIGVFSNESALCIRWPKYWSFSISPSSEYSGLISFRVDWFDRLAVQGTLKNLLQHYGSKASILWCSVFFRVQLSQLCLTTGKTIALTRWNFVGILMSLLFNTLSRFVIGFLPRSECLLILWLQFPSTVILEPLKMKSNTFSTFPPLIFHEVIGPDAMIFVCFLKKCNVVPINAQPSLCWV